LDLAGGGGCSKSGFGCGVTAWGVATLLVSFVPGRCEWYGAAHINFVSLAAVTGCCGLSQLAIDGCFRVTTLAIGSALRIMNLVGRGMARISFDGTGNITVASR